MRPNIVVFMTDQQRGATVLDGHRVRAKTPHLDALAADGVTFSHAYTVSPHCCPSRASFFTGRYPSEHGVWNNVKLANALSQGPDPDTPFWSEAMTRAGYRLGFAGKWHVSTTTNPRDYGWDEAHVTSPGQFPAGTRADEMRREALERDLEMYAKLPRREEGTTRRPGEIVRPGYPPYVHYATADDPFGDALVVDSAIDVVRSWAAHGDGQPRLLYAGTLGPHDPYQPPQKFLDLYDPAEIELDETFEDPMTDKPALYRRIRDRFDQLSEAEHREALRHYLAFCSYEDALFGRLVDAVTEAGQLDNTIFVYTSDHGDYTGDHGLWCKGLPAFESNYHIPAVVGGKRLPRAARDTTVDTPISIVDFGPTLVELCDVPDAPPMSGRSFAAALRGEPLPKRDAVFFQSNGNETYGNQRVIITDRWKLVVNLFDFDELYDRRADPGELHNLMHDAHSKERQVGIRPMADLPADLEPVVAELYSALWRFGLEHGDTLTQAYIMTALGTYGPGVGIEPAC